MTISPGPEPARPEPQHHRLLVRLTPGTAGTTHPSTARDQIPVPAPNLPDLRAIARAVQDLVHAVAPALTTGVEIEVRTPGPETSQGQQPTAARCDTSAILPTLGPSGRGDPVGALSTGRTAPSGGAVRNDVGELPVPLRALQDPRRYRPGGDERLRRPPGVLDVDPIRRTLTLDGETVDLTRREFDLIAFLEAHRGEALGREDLMQAIWRTSYVSGDRTVDVHVRRLRVKLGRHARRLVTLRGFGYRLD